MRNICQENRCRSPTFLLSTRYQKWLLYFTPYLDLPFLPSVKSGGYQLVRVLHRWEEGSHSLMNMATLSTLADIPKTEFVNALTRGEMPIDSLVESACRMLQYLKIRSSILTSLNTELTETQGQ